VTEYRIICVVRDSDDEIEAVGYSERGIGVMYDDRWTIEQVRRAIEQGHRLYTINPSTGHCADLELYGDGVRVRLVDGNEIGLADLPDCG
jgi:hypothetical protein